MKWNRELFNFDVYLLPGSLLPQMSQMQFTSNIQLSFPTPAVLSALRTGWIDVKLTTLVLPNKDVDGVERGVGSNFNISFLYHPPGIITRYTLSSLKTLLPSKQSEFCIKQRKQFLFL